MATIISSTGASRPAPKWWRNTERALLIVLIPATISIIQTWGFEDDAKVMRLLLMINIGLVAVIKAIGMFLVDTDDNYVSNLSDRDQAKITTLNTPPVDPPKDKTI